MLQVCDGMRPPVGAMTALMLMCKFQKLVCMCLDVAELPAVQGITYLQERIIAVI